MNIQNRAIGLQLPDLNQMSDAEAVRWYTSEVARISKERLLDSEYAIALLDWKRKMNVRLRENRLKWLEE